jgi:SAM-dependent methyltransferase
VITHRDTCRLCGKRQLDPAIQLTPTPPANAFVPEEQVKAEQTRFPLDVFQCRDCGHVQLLDIVDPEILFGDYVYVSGTSPVFVEHFRQYADALLERAAPPENALVVDIGSNDGTLLKFFRDKGLRALGIEPAEKIAAMANANNVETLGRFFTTELAASLRDARGPASIITANNVYAHIDDLRGVAEGVRTLLAPDGLFSFEVSYLIDVLEKTYFDTIYHEHLSYHSVKPLVSFFASLNMELIDAVRVPTHGGSLRCIVQHAGGPHTLSGSVAELVALEESRNIYDVDTYRKFGEDIEAVRTELSRTLRDLKAAGKRIAGYGAPAKAATLLYHFNLGDVLDFIVDDSPLKQNLFSPGQHIPVVSSETMYEDMPDYLLILAWNFADPIIKNNQLFLEKGGGFIIPLPTVDIITEVKK